MKTSIRTLAMALAASAAASTAHGAGLTLGTTPLYLGSSVAPIVMLTVSKDEQLFQKLYNDYTDLDGDGLLDTTYKHSINYYGYFDAFKCYNYDTASSLFVPIALSPASNKYCETVGGGRWSGNFLNWATMTRADAVRKILYGGHRSSDTAALTVLERANIPYDTHAFAKYYHGADINRLTPFTTTVTTAANGVATGSNNVYGAPATVQTIDATTPKHFKNLGISVCKGDQVRVNLGGTGTANFVIGYVSAVNGVADCSTTGAGSGFSMVVKAQGVAGVGNSNAANAFTVSNLSSTGITICNVTDAGSTNRSHTTTNPPLIKVAQGNFAMWANNDIVQCQWNPANNTRTFAGTGSNGNEGALSGGLSTVFPVGSVNWAAAHEPIQARHGLAVGGVFNFVARVEACKAGVLGFERCKAYGAGFKPIGLLQFYGEPDLLYFGLMTGSYAKNKSGGVLRKNAGSFTNEVNAANGTFIVPAGGGIVDTLNRLRIYGYDYSTSSYAGAGADQDACGVVTSASGTATLNRGDAQEGICTSWGNPVAETYLESLRYLAGKTADAAFTYAAGSKDDQVSGAPGLPKPAWVDPMSDTTRYCRPLNVLVFSANVSSFDNDQLGNVTQLNTASSAAALTNTVGTAESINGNNFFVGNDGGLNNNELCTLKTGISFGNVFGICPESPRGRGSFLISGIAHHAHTNRIRVAPDPTAVAVPATNTRALKVNTYGITLAANSGTVQIPVGANTVTLLPIARVQDIILGAQVPPSASSGGLIDFKVIQQTATSGKFFVQWEVSQQGADRDLDLWGVISYSINTGVTPNTITVTTDVISANPSGFLGFGYVIAGTNQDGAHFHSGYNTFNYTYNPGTIVECANCQTADAPSSKTYNVQNSSAQILKDPLFYAAKYGGFNDVNSNNTPDQVVEWDSKKIDGSDGSDGIPDNYFPVTNPAALEGALDRAFIYILQVSSASSVATNSTSLTTGSRVYQARFNSNEWSGQLLSFTISASGVIDPVPNFDAGQLLPASSSRIITTYSPGATPGTSSLPAGVAFRWGNLSTAQQTELRKDGASQVVDSTVGGACTSDNVPIGCTDRGPLRLEWLRGNPVAEGTTATALRVRPSTKLADIVNSTPRYVGPPSASFTDASYLSFRSTYAGRTPMLYVGSNGGMFHAFEATTGSSGGVETFAYVPNKMYQNLTRLTTKPYSHRYFVDGTPSVNDACFGACAAGNDWKTVAVGGYNSGGQGYYALNVTDPSTWSTEGSAAASVLWEFTDVNDPDLGYSYSKPLIVKMSNGRWAAVFGNGYNNSIAEAGELACDIGTGTTADPYGRSDAQPGCSTSLTGHASLFILFLDGGTDGVWTQGVDYIKISTNTGTDTATPSNLTPGTPNGIATPVAIDSNGDGMVDFIYAGDLVGNVWKFDVTSAGAGGWTVASGGTPLFIAQDASGNRQPITSAPVLNPHSGGGFIVLFGTGKYMEITDDTGPFGMSAFYGIWDKLDNTTVVRSDLMQQKVLNVNAGNLDGGLIVGTNKVRLTSAYVPNYSGTDRTNSAGTFGDADVDPDFVAPTATTPANQRGWFLEMPNSGNGGAPNNPATGTGEKIVFDPLISTGKIVFTTLLPSTQPCDAGGTSFIMDMDPVSGSRLSFSPFDLNADNNFTSADFVSYGGRTIAVSGLGSTIGIVPQPTVIQGVPGKEVKVLSGSSGGLMAVLENAPTSGPTGARTGRRITWREMLSN